MLLAPRRRGDCAGVACEHTLGRQPLHLYGYLWAKPEFLVDDQSGRFSFVVPDTILFKHQKPIKWFFTSHQDKGKILTKSKKHLNTTHVLQALLQPKQSLTSPRQRKKHDAPVDDDNAVVATFVYPDRASNGELVMIVEHLTPTELQRLLVEREKPPISVLQRFIPTRSGYNHLIQSVFTPDSCVLRKCVNSNLVSNTSVCLPARIATFEADDRLVKPRDVTNHEMRDRIEHMHLEMSNHLKKIIGKPVARNVAYFKHGADDRIYLLWSTMLSFETGTLAFAKNMRLSLSHQDRLQHLIATTTASLPPAENNRSTVLSSSFAHSQTKICPACRSMLPNDVVDFVATFKAIINAFATEPLTPNRPVIPPLLESILPPTSDERFKELIHDKEFLYRTVALCQPCATRINSSEKVKAMKTAEAIESVHARKAEQERDKPIYMQSAHSIFWGKVEREQAARENSDRRLALQSRPQSAKAEASRPSARIRKFAVSRSEELPNGLTHATLKRLLPVLAERQGSVNMSHPKHCMQMLADYLQQSCGCPSVRRALARMNIYPPTSHVPAELLQRVVEPVLLADAVAHWNEVSKIHGNAVSGMIDLDSVDAMLSAYTDASAPSQGSRSVRPLHLEPKCASSRRSVPVIPHAPTSARVPVRPTINRPASCGVVRSASSGASRLAHGSVSTETFYKPVAHSNDLLSHEPDAKPSSQSHPALIEKAPTVFHRIIDGILYELRISAVVEDTARTFALHIQAVRAQDPEANQNDGVRSRLNPTELTLGTRELVELVARSSQLQTNAQIPLTGHALIQLVMDQLTIESDCLSVRSRAAMCPPVATATSPQHDLGDSTLTDEELRFLQESLES